MKHPCLLTISMLCFAGCGSDVFFRVPDPVVRYLPFGDSATAGPSERNYPDFLREFLGESEETFTNEGQSGETVSEGLDRLHLLIDKEIYPNAAVFLYWEGGNDIVDFIGRTDPLLLLSPDDADYPFETELSDELDRIQTTIETALRTAQDEGMDVYVATYFALAPGVTECDALPFNIALPKQIERADAYTERLNDRIRRAAAARGATLIDIASFNAAFQADPANYVNCNHLSAAGNEIVARLFLNVVDPVPSTP